MSNRYETTTRQSTILESLVRFDAEIRDLEHVIAIGERYKSKGMNVSETELQGLREKLKAATDRRTSFEQMVFGKTS